VNTKEEPCIDCTAYAVHLLPAGQNKKRGRREHRGTCVQRRKAVDFR